MEELIRQAFLHIEVIGPHVAEGHYDLVGPNGDIILPQVWETVIEPDWTITMHMWPIPEKPKSPDPAEGGTVPEGQATAETAPGSADSAVIVAADDSKKKSEPAAGMFKFLFISTGITVVVVLSRPSYHQTQSGNTPRPLLSLFFFFFFFFFFPPFALCSTSLFKFATVAHLFFPSVNIAFDFRYKETTSEGARPRRFCHVDGG
jgi:hypothetical protein